MNAREYLLTKMTAMSAEMHDEALRDERLRREYQKSEFMKYVTMSQAVQFWRAMDPALKAEAAEWRKVREEMARHGRRNDDKPAMPILLSILLLSSIGGRRILRRVNSQARTM